MATSLIYKHPTLYEAAMLVLYGRHYFSRYRAISQLIPEGASVLDVCCGPGILYSRYLSKKRVSYMGLDMNKGFVERLKAAGVDARLWDLRNVEALPSADYVVMEASLYHFLPNAAPIVDRMLDASRRQVIIAEPIANLATSRVGILAKLGRRFTDSGHGEEALRFTEETLDALFSKYGSVVKESFVIPGGREKVFVLEKEHLL